MTLLTDQASMKYLSLLFLLLPLSTQAQDFVSDIEDIQLKIAEQEMDEFLKKPTAEGLPGPFLNSLLPVKTLDPETNCEEEKEPKKGHYEIVVVAEATSERSELEILPGQKAALSTSNLKSLIEYVPPTMTSGGLHHDSVMERAAQLWNSGRVSTSGPLNPSSQLGRELIIESIVHASARSNLSERDLSREIAGTIGNIYKTDEERYNALSALSLRLYRNYNDSRNPGFNNATNNPYGAEIPAGDISANDLLRAAAEFNVYQGGVCNDISEVVAQVGEHLFPDKDVLTINSGTHFGVLVTDGKNHYVIDGGREMSMSGRMFLRPDLNSSNLRINKVVNGKQKEIAVVDTQLGQVLESAFKTGKTLLKTEADVSSLVTHLKKNNFGAAVAAAKLADSNVMVVVAKYDNASEKGRAYIGAGLSLQDFDNDMNSRYQVHFRAGAERSLIRYANSHAKVNFSSGVRLAGMSALNQSKGSEGVAALDISGALDVYNRLDADFGQENPGGVKVKTSLEVEHTLGPSNWGNTTGALSYMEPRDTDDVLKNLSFHLNQVNANATVEKNLSSRVTGFANVHYQGSNIGQSVSVLGGINIKAPEGAEIIVFAGYTKADIGGYKTKHSMLGEDTGEQVGVQYSTKRGTRINLGTKNVSNKDRSINLSVEIPIGR